MSKLVQYLYGDSLRHMLEPDEQILAFTKVGEPPNSSSYDFLRATTPDSSPDARTRPWVLGFSLLHGGVQWNLERHHLWLGGTSGTGAPGSIGRDLWLLYCGATAALAGVDATAGQRWATIRTQAPDPDLVAVTDRRLLLLSSDTGGKTELRAEISRDQIRGARRRSCGLRVYSRGRVEVTFADGSMKALHLGWLRAGRARRVVQALIHRPSHSGGASI